MELQQESKEQLNFISVAKFYVRWFIPLVIVLVLAGVAAIIFSMPFFLTPKYESTVVLYPTATSSVAKAILSTDPGASRESIVDFGEDEAVDQLLQILNSDAITNRIMVKYDLLNHYGIKPGNPRKFTDFADEFKSNVKYRRTEFSSIEISVLDENPDIAAAMANDIAALLDSAKTAIQQRRAMQALALVQVEYDKKQEEIQEILDSLQRLGDLGVMAYEEQAKILSEAITKARATNRQNEVADLQERLTVLAKYGPIHYRLNEQLNYEVEQMTRLKRRLDEIRAEATSNVSHTFVVNYASPAEIKAWPRRSYIVIGVLLATFVLCTLIFAAIENYSRMRQSLK